MAALLRRQRTENGLDERGRLGSTDEQCYDFAVTGGPIEHDNVIAGSAHPVPSRPVDDDGCKSTIRTGACTLADPVPQVL
jgi:hypothetical protein